MFLLLLVFTWIGNAARDRMYSYLVVVSLIAGLSCSSGRPAKTLDPCALIDCLFELDAGLSSCGMRAFLI